VSYSASERAAFQAVEPIVHPNVLIAELVEPKQLHGVKLTSLCNVSAAFQCSRMKNRASDPVNILAFYRGVTAIPDLKKSWLPGASKPIAASICHSAGESGHNPPHNLYVIPLGKVVTTPHTRTCQRMAFEIVTAFRGGLTMFGYKTHDALVHAGMS
jgi:hypothetical protein